MNPAGVTRKEKTKTKVHFQFWFFFLCCSARGRVGSTLCQFAGVTDASIWIGLQADYNMQKVKQDKSFMKRLENIRKIVAVF